MQRTIEPTENLVVGPVVSVRRRRRNLFPILLILPAILIITLIIVYPLVYSINVSIRAVTINNIRGAWPFVGLDNFRAVFSDSDFFIALGNNVFFTTVTVSGQVILGMALALLLHSKRLRVPNLFRTLLLFPMFISAVVVAYQWKWLFLDLYGLINYLLEIWRIAPYGVPWLSSPTVAIYSIMIADTWQALPFVMLILLSGLSSIPDDYYSAAAVDGAGRWAQFRYVTLPLLRLPILVAILIRTMDSLRVFDLIYVLTHGGPGSSTEMLSSYIYRVTFDNGQFGYGTALSFVQWLVIGVISLVYMRVLLRRGER